MRGCFAVLTAAGAVAIASSASAEPVTRPAQVPCKVHIVDAPADARAEIEAWVRAEPRCERELEVHVVATDDGLYLSARDGEGRVRERNVPDAQAAAVLVVSWMADDSLGPDTPSPALRAVPAASAPAASAPASKRPAIIDDEMPDGLRANGPDLGGQRRRFGRWFGIGAMASEHRHPGVRGELELFHTHRLSLGVAAGWRPIGDRESGMNGSRPGAGAGQLRVLVGTERSFGRLTLSAHVGVGADVATGDRQDYTEMTLSGASMPLVPVPPPPPTGDHDGEDRVVPAVELGVLGRVKVTDHWGLLGGPLLGTSAAHHEPQLSVFVGVVRSL